MHVAAAVIERQDGKILLSKRHEHAHQGGLWEFPGGKVELGERAEQALIRELREELGIEAESFRKLISINHSYNDRNVRLDVYKVSAWQGDVKPLENQPLVWIYPDEIKHYDLPAADEPIATAINLPDTYFITPPQIQSQPDFLNHIENALKQGIRLVQYRVFGLEKAQNLQLAEAVKRLCKQFGAKLLVNKDIELMRQIGADGLHLNSEQLTSKSASQLVSGSLITSASCHSREELEMAAKLVDFAVLSPVLPTKSHPDSDTLGWGAFAELIDNINMPVYALGGMKTNNLQTSFSFGAQGIAGIRGMLYESEKAI